MAYVIQKIYTLYHYLANEYSDPRSENLFLGSSPFVVALMLIGYLYFTCNFGPRWMNDRKGMSLKPIIISYNIFQIISNAMLLVYGTYWTYGQNHYKILCTPPSPISDLSDQGYREVYITYLFYLLKVADLLDTLFFVLKKQNGHISFLHVYHHVAMVIASFMALKLYPVGNGAMLGVLNCFVHICMYSYYLYAALSSNEKKVWWKKYITQLQIIQFILLALHFFQCTLNTSCTYPKWICLLLGVQNLFVMCMFGDFYIKSYMK